MQFLAGLKANRFAGRNRHLGAGARIAPDAGLTWPYGKNAKAAQLNALALLQGMLQRFKDGLHRRLAFVAGQTSPLNYMMDNVLLNQRLTPWRASGIQYPGRKGMQDLQRGTCC